MNRRGAIRAVTLVLCLLGAAFGLVVSQSSADTGTAAGQTAQGDIQQRLAGSQSVYVAEREYEFRDRENTGLNYNGFAAFIDGSTDTLVERTAAGYGLSLVAVSPDGSLVYITDEGKPVLHVFDAETRKEVREIELPGVTTGKNTVCASGVACTPDGSMVLVGSNAGLQVVDAASDKVVRTISDLRPVSDEQNFKSAVAVSFDGKRAYVTSTDSAGGYRLVCIDLKTWEIVKEIAVDSTWAIAVKPDDSQVFFSEWFSNGFPRVRVVDALTLEDLWTVSFEDLMTKDSTAGQPRGLAFLPDGTKAYVVCFSMAITPEVAPGCFCSVVDTAQKKVIKEIPLNAAAGNTSGSQAVAVRSDGTKAYINGDSGQHAIVIDTINDVVLEVIGDESGGTATGEDAAIATSVVNLQTIGVAVRPFWWSTECLVSLGLASASGESDTTGVGDATSTSGLSGAGTTSGASGETGESSDGGSAGDGNEDGGSAGDNRADSEGGLSGGWIALITVLAVLAAGLLGAVGYLIGRVRRGSKRGAAGAEIAGTGAGTGSSAGNGAVATAETLAAAQASSAVQASAAAESGVAHEAAAAMRTAPATTETAAPKTGVPPCHCSACGALLDAGGKFCPGCGRQL